MAVNRTDNAVLFWNGVLLDAMKADSQKPIAQREQDGPTRTSRAAAIVHAAIHNAVNGVQQRVAFYQDPKTNQPAFPGPPPAPARQEAAGAGAAYRALVTLFPTQTAPLFNPKRAEFQALPLPGANHQPSFAYGDGIAQQLLNARASDGSGAAGAYVPPAPGPGVWVPDPTRAPPGPPLTPNWGNVQLFLLANNAQVLPPAFPDLLSDDYALAFRNVRDKGRDPSPPPQPPQGRTMDEENIGKFYSYDYEEGTVISLYNLHAFEMLDQEPNVPTVASVLHRHARMFALINLSMADAGIACWEAKFLPPPGYHIWRPFQAIPGAASDGNPQTQPVASWLPLGPPLAPVNNATPNFPSYPSGHASIGTASYGMLRKFFGLKEFPFTLSSNAGPNNRSFVDTIDLQTGGVITTWTQVINENMVSRVFLGVHFMPDALEGRPTGQKVADYIWPRFLRP